MVKRIKLIAVCGALAIIGCSKDLPDPNAINGGGVNGGDVSGVPLGGGYEAVLFGGDTIHHIPGNLQLWFAPPGGKRVMVWPYLVNDGRVLGNTIVFTGGLSDDRRWKGYPALMAYTPPGPPVEITECVTKDYSLKNQLDFGLLHDSLCFSLYRGHKDGEVSLVGVSVRSNGIEEGIITSITAAEVKKWLDEGLASGVLTNYSGVAYRRVTSGTN